MHPLCQALSEHLRNIGNSIKNLFLLISIVIKLFIKEIYLKDINANS